MKTETENKNLIRRFLFGEMAEKERLEFEEGFLSNADLFEQIKGFEDDLIEKYVRGWMNAADRAKFEQNFLTTGKRRERVEFARLLIDQLRDDSAIGKKAAESEKVSIWEKFVELFSTPKIALTGAAVIIVLFGTWFLFLNQGVERAEVVKNQNSATPAATNKIITPEIESNAVNSNQKNEPDTETDPSNAANEPFKTPTPVKEKIPEPKKTPEQNSAPNPVLALFPGTLRSEGKSVELTLPENAAGATIRLNLETVDYQTFHAELTDADGNPIFRKSDLKPQKSGLNLFIPAKNLKKGDYLIKLSGKNNAGENESVADFQFRVN